MDNIPTKEELFRVIMIDRQRKVRINIKLHDKEGQEVPIGETIEQLTEWISDQLKAEGNNRCSQQIMPLMGQAVVGGMTKLLGSEGAALILSDEINRYGLVHMMTVGFYLVRFIQKHELSIDTLEEPITDEDITMYDRISRASDMTVQASAVGIDPSETINKLIEMGKLKQSDLDQIGYKSTTKKEESN